MEQIVLVAGIILCLFGAYAWVGAIRAERRWARIRDEALKAIEESVAFTNEGLERWEAAEALARSLEIQDGQG